MLNRCMNCGGSLRYDIASGKVKCIHCETNFEAEQYDTNTAAEEYGDDSVKGQDYEATIFTCPSCGAEISSTELSAVDYCLYCGSFVTLESRMTKVRRPELILPFSKTEEECKKIYRRKLRKMPYAPKEFRNEEFIDGFKGIYIPYWCYDYKYGPEIKIHGTDSHRKGDYIVTQHYNINCQADGSIDGITYDASSTFDDEISSKIAPFEREKMKPFHPGYMFGFYGDMADITSDVYEEDAVETARDGIWDQISVNPKIKHGHPDKPEPKKFEKDFNLKKNATLSMLPVWFLTWRKGEKVAYSVVNGDSGEMYSEIPVSIIRYLLISLITAIPIFFLLNFAFTFTATGMLKIALVLSMVMIALYMTQLEKIVRKVMHSDDRGYLTIHEDVRKENEEKITENFLMLVITESIGFVKELGWYMLGAVFFLLAIGAVFINYLIIALILLAIVVPVYVVYRIVKNAKLLKDYTILFDLVGAVFAILVSAFILFLDPAPDMFYYFAAILCMAGIGLSAVSIMRRHNDLITRPVPHFFDRKKGGE